MKHELSVRDAQLHLWRYQIRESFEISPKVYDILSEEEDTRLTRVRLEDHKKTYAASHVFLRMVFGKYTGLSPGEILFVKDKHKKPFLDKKQIKLPLYFNLAYRHEYALLVISALPYIGVDIEKIIDIDHFDSFSSAFFSPEESEKVIAQIQKARKLEALYTIWTMKEALVKAMGVGFSKPLVQYNLIPFLHSNFHIPDFDNPNPWWISQVDINKNYIASYAARTEKLDLEIFEYENH